MDTEFWMREEGCWMVDGEKEEEGEEDVEEEDMLMNIPFESMGGRQFMGQTYNFRIIGQFSNLEKTIS